MEKREGFEDLGDLEQYTDYKEFTVPTHFICAMVNGDYSALTDEEEKEVNEFLKPIEGMTLNFPSDTDYYKEMEHDNDVNNGKFADCVKMIAITI